MPINGVIRTTTTAILDHGRFHPVRYVPRRFSNIVYSDGEQDESEHFVSAHREMRRQH